MLALSRFRVVRRRDGGVLLSREKLMHHCKELFDPDRLQHMRIETGIRRVDAR